MARACIKFTSLGFFKSCKRAFTFKELTFEEVCIRLDALASHGYWWNKYGETKDLSQENIAYLECIKTYGGQRFTPEERDKITKKVDDILALPTRTETCVEKTARRPIAPSFGLAAFRFPEVS